MQQQYKYKQFTFSNLGERSIAQLDYILTYIDEAVAGFANSKDIFLRSKWILTELYTNASKHSNDAVICFEVQIKPEALQITKSDHGEPFSVLVNGEKKFYPIDFSEADTCLLHEDDLSILYATAKDNMLIFSVKDNTNIMDVTVQRVSEHFGLIIITRASDNFSYRYDACTQTNIFTASLVF